MTTARQLTIQIDSAGLTALAAAGQLVALVRPEPMSRYAVVWQAIAPTSAIVVSWHGCYRVYQSTTPLRAGAQLRVGSSASAAAGYRYTFTGGQFDAGAAGLAQSEVGIVNQDPAVTMAGVAMFIGGLCQTATVSGQPATSPLGAAPVLLGEQLIDQIGQRVLVFPAGGVRAGTVLDSGWLTGSAADAVVVGEPLALDLATVTEQCIRYDDVSNRFVLGSG